MTVYHLAQINIARMLGTDIDDPIMADFVAQIDHINALAEAAPGFIWRLKSDTGNALDIQAYDDPRFIVNMSVWESIDALHQFTYYSEHADVYRRRREWFDKLEVYMALWWIPVGHTPDEAEGKARLEYLEANGPSPHAFTFKQRFEPVAE